MVIFGRELQKSRSGGKIDAIGLINMAPSALQLHHDHKHFE